MDQLSLIFFLYTATALTALAISVFQFVYEKKQIYKYSVYFWITVCLSLFVNILNSKFNIANLILSGLGTLASQLILGMILSRMSKNDFSIKPYVVFFGVLAVLIESIPIVKDYKILYITILSFAATLPALYTSFKFIFSKSHKKTSSQILLAVFTFLMSLHYLDYGYTTQNPNLYLLGLIVSFFLLHSISTLIPMAINELDLQQRNENLEEEIRNRIALLRKRDHLVWENNRLSNLGHFSGILAHEINTPLSTISVATQHMQNLVSKEIFDITKYTEKITLVKKSVKEISDMTTQLKTVADHSVNSYDSAVDLVELLSEIQRSLNTMADHPHINIIWPVNDVKQTHILGNPKDLDHLLRNLIQHFIDEFEQINITNKCQITIIISTINNDKINLNFTSNDECKKHINHYSSLATNLSIFNLNFIVAKSLAERNQASLEYDQTQYNLNLSFSIIKDEPQLNNHSSQISGAFLNGI